MCKIYPKSNLRNMSMDILRVIACLMVITLHVTAEGVYQRPTSALITLHCVTAGAAPLFFMLSGAFTQETCIRKYVFKALKMVILFFFFHVFFIVSDCFFIHGTITLPLLYDLGITSLRINKYHLWYLSEYAGVLLIAPIINSAVKSNKSIIKYICGLFFIYTIIPELLSSVGIQLNTATKLNEIIPLQPIGYIGYFCLGKMLFYHYSVSSNKRRATISTALVLWVLVVSAASVITISASASTERFDTSKVGRFSPLVLIADTLLFIVFAVGSNNHSSKRNISNHSIFQKLMGQIVPCSLWIYLIHPFFMDLFLHWGLSCQSIPTLVSVPLKVILVFIPSLLFGLVCSKLSVLFNSIYVKRLRPYIIFIYSHISQFIIRH